MDQFGVLVESIGFKAHGKSSAPLADLKGTNRTNGNTNDFSRDVGLNADFSSFHRSNLGYNSNSSLNVDDLDGIFRSNNSNDRKPPNSGFDDVFGGVDSGANGIDMDSVFKVSNSNNYDDDDVFGLKKTNSGSGSGSVSHYDMFGSNASPFKKANSIDDLFGNFGGMGMKSNGSRNNFGGKQANASKYDDLLGNLNGNGMKSNGFKKNSVKKQETASESDDLLSGFGVKSPSSKGMKSETNPSHQSSGHSAKSVSASAEDSFVVLERAHGSSKANYGASVVEDYLGSFFSSGTQASTRSSQRSTAEDSVYDALFNNNIPKAEKASSESSYSTKKASSRANSSDDFSYLFEIDAPSSGEFQEIKGESEERRRARLNHHMMTQERMAKALNEKNQRDLQAQREQEERHRVAATLDGDIKRWAVGKEGNLRALLSSLQYILWPESGWQPISLTNLITSTSVKKAYYKATLYVHPDKVQQKGANIQQKYIAEKVFDLLKEAWNKFNTEEFKKQ